MNKTGYLPGEVARLSHLKVLHLCLHYLADALSASVTCDSLRGLLYLTIRGLDVPRLRRALCVSTIVLRSCAYRHRDSG